MILISISDTPVTGVADGHPFEIGVPPCGITLGAEGEATLLTVASGFIPTLTT
jgi:hypothetical protein